VCRVVAIFLTFVFVATGSGAASHVHRLEHAALGHPAAPGHDPGVPKATAAGQDADADHDPGNDHDSEPGHSCATCAVLAAPAVPWAHVAPALRPEPARSREATSATLPPDRRAPLRIACRGPPVA
jgi:hypothetical protein